MASEATTFPRRFYRTVAVVEAGEGFTIHLDARALKTPARASVSLPTRALAELCAAEWDGQGEFIVPSSMPVTQLAFAAIDWASRDRQERIDYALAFARSDLCCHRAASPSELAARQEECWGRFVRWATETLGAPLPVVTGVIAAQADEASIGTLRAHAVELDDYALTALAQAAGLTGSILVAFALARGEANAQEAFEAAALDELWSLAHWGEDAEARARLERLRTDISAVGRFLTSLDGVAR
ncbi:MAG: ATP12 family chaperone protein [Hyphomonadaceae bacterium]